MIEEQPAHEHDCPTCIFLGTDAPTAPHEKKTNAVDMYLCQTERGIPLLIRRWGSDAMSVCLVDFVDQPWWATALSAAKAKGVL